MKLRSIKSIAIAIVAVLALGSCKEHIDEGARYTFTGHTIASFMEENEDIYSSFIYILTRGGRYSLMQAYGTYTCFAPTNDAIAKYLYEQDSIYQTSLIETPENPIWTGITSPELTELSDSMCKVISQTHLLNAVYLTTDMEGDIIPTMNMNDRYLSLSYDVDENNFNVLLINGTSKIIAKDEEVENGVIHTIASVLNPSTNTVPAQIDEFEYFHIISEAIKKTGYDDKMQLYKDETYADGEKTIIGIYESNGQVPYPANRYYGFTAFLETDSVFNANGIYNFEDLKARCEEWYPKANPDADFTSPENPVNQFVGYHLLDRKLAYSRLVCYRISHDKWDSEKDLVDRKFDRHEYYETLNGRLMKLTMPRSNPTHQTDILINYSKDTEASANQYMNTLVYNPDNFMKLSSEYADFNPQALNGNIHAIDKILLYNEDVMAGRVLNDIIRVDFTSLCPELTNNNMRWNCFTHSGDGEIYIPHTYSDNMKAYTEETRLYMLTAHTNWFNYQGDEMMAQGSYDFAYKLPPVPAGTYELRMGYSANGLRGIVQFYVDNEVCGIPVDLRIATKDKAIGYVPDANTEDNGIQNDKEMKNRGYLKAGTSYRGSNENNIARDDAGIIRKVITTKYFSEGEHWLRFKNVMDNDNGSYQFMHDYLEIVPMSFLRDETISLDEKRK